MECEGVGKPRGEMGVNEVVKMGVVQEAAEVANLRIAKKVKKFDNRKLCDLMLNNLLPCVSR